MRSSDNLFMRTYVLTLHVIIGLIYNSLWWPASWPGTVSFKSGPQRHLVTHFKAPGDAQLSDIQAEAFKKKPSDSNGGCAMVWNDSRCCCCWWVIKLGFLKLYSIIIAWFDIMTDSESQCGWRLNDLSSQPFSLSVTVGPFYLIGG